MYVKQLYRLRNFINLLSMILMFNIHFCSSLEFLSACTVCCSCRQFLHINHSFKILNSSILSSISQKLALFFRLLLSFSLICKLLLKFQHCLLENRNPCQIFSDHSIGLSNVSERRDSMVITLMSLCLWTMNFTNASQCFPIM